MTCLRPFLVAMCFGMSIFSIQIEAGEPGEVWIKQEASRGVHNQFPSWSTDGKLLAYVSHEPDKNVQVCLFDPSKKTHAVLFDASSLKLEEKDVRLKVSGLAWLDSDEFMFVLAEVDKKRRCKALRFFLVTSGSQARHKEIARFSYDEIRNSMPWMPHQYVRLPKGKGIAVCLSIWPKNQTADERHQGKIVAVHKNGTRLISAKTYRWIDNTADGQLLGVRYDGAWILNDRLQPGKKLLALEGKPMLQAIRISPSGECGARAFLRFPKRMSGFEMPVLEWSRRTNNKWRPFNLEAPGVRIKDCHIFRDGRLCLVVSKTEWVEKTVKGGNSRGETYEKKMKVPVEQVQPAKLADATGKILSTWRIEGLADKGVASIDVAPHESAGIVTDKDGNVYAYFLSSGKAVRVHRVAAAEEHLSLPVQWAPDGTAFAVVVQCPEKTGVLYNSNARFKLPNSFLHIAKGRILIFSARKGK